MGCVCVVCVCVCGVCVVCVCVVCGVCVWCVCVVCVCVVCVCVVCVCVRCVCVRVCVWSCDKKQNKQLKILLCDKMLSRYIADVISGCVGAQQIRPPEPEGCRRKIERDLVTPPVLFHMCQ